MSRRIEGARKATMDGLVIVIAKVLVALCVFGLVMSIFLCLNSGSISEEEREAEFKKACKRAKEIWNRSHNNDV
jgi:flagellar basal body-associated protein FliL